MARNLPRRPIAPFILWICTAFAALTAFYPVVRSFFRVEVNYNEGWNIYNADLVLHHRFLYPVKYAWTCVNYPMLSFVLMSWLHHLTHDFLFTARIVSLLSLAATCILVGAIVSTLGASRRAAILTSLFTLALFCTVADPYVGMDDPQLLAQLFFVAGLLVYIRHRESYVGLAMTALLLVVGGNIKHSQIDFPLAILIDLLFFSLVRAAWFSVIGLILAGISVALNLHFGGPFYIAEMLTPRDSHLVEMYHGLGNKLKYLALPLLISLYMAFQLSADSRRRIAALLLIASLFIGGYFSGATGVSINIIFSILIAFSILVGLFFVRIESSDLTQTAWTASPWTAYAPLLLFASLIIPWVRYGDQNPVRNLRKTMADQATFAQEVALIESRPGPALCESLLRCFDAGKPYLYDPFNATRLISFGKLDPQVIVDGLRTHQYGAVQLAASADRTQPKHSTLYAPPILDAIQQYYTPTMVHPDVFIYLPRDTSTPTVR